MGARTNAKFIATYAYLFAAWLLIFSLLMVLDEEGLRFKEPKQFADITALAASGQDSRKLQALLGSEGTYAMKVLSESEGELGDAIRTPGMPWILSMAALRGVFTFVSLIISWSVFRRMLGISWLRSFLALTIFLGIGLIVALLVVFLQMAPIVVDPHRWIDKWLTA